MAAASPGMQTSTLPSAGLGRAGARCLRSGASWSGPATNKAGRRQAAPLRMLQKRLQLQASAQSGEDGAEQPSSVEPSQLAPTAPATAAGATLLGAAAALPLCGDGGNGGSGLGGGGGGDGSGGGGSGRRPQEVWALAEGDEEGGWGLLHVLVGWAAQGAEGICLWKRRLCFHAAARGA